MKTLFFLATVVASLTSQHPVAVRKMVVFEENAPARTIILDEPLTIRETPVDYTFDLAGDGKGCSVAFYEADTSKPEGIGRACSFVSVKDWKKVELKDNGERYDVKARGYYKSLFVDAGFRLNNYWLPSHFKWITTLGLENDYEYIQTGVKDSAKVVAIQNGVMVGAPTEEIDWKDDNGVLLYPDGEPRFRMMYANGGNSSKHGPTLGYKGRHQVRTFFENGGSYVGTCAGAFLACVSSRKGNRYDNPDPEIENYTFGLYPGALISTHVPIDIKKFPSVYTAMDLTDRWKEIGTQFGYSFADTIESVRHHGGGYLKDEELEQFPGVEPLMRYRYTEKNPDDSCSYTAHNRPLYRMYGKGTKPGVRKSINGRISTFAWKESSASGRVCITGSHPEKGEIGGNNHNMIRMMAQYAMDGNGEPQAKCALKAGRTYTDPDGVGDLQYHHFTFTSEKEMKNVKIVLDSKSKADLYLTLRNGDFAWLSDADYMVCSEGGKKTLTIASLPAGTWYIGVYCATTVKASVEKDKKNYNYFYYVDKYDVLNGVKYKLTIK